MINRVILVGRLTKTPELKSTPNGKSVVNFTLAVQRDKDNTDFINCIAWSKTAEILAQYTLKGSLVAVEGRIQTRTYDSNGEKKYVTEVVCDGLTLCDSKPKEENVSIEQMVIPKPLFYTNITDEELPF